MTGAKKAKEYGVWLPRLGEARLVNFRRGLQGRLFYMHDVLSGINSCGFSVKECIKAMDELLTRMEAAT